MVEERNRKEDKGSSHGSRGMAGSLNRPQLRRATALKNVEYQLDQLDYDSNNDDSVHSTRSTPRTPKPSSVKGKKYLRDRSFRVGGKESERDLEELCDFLGVSKFAGLGIDTEDWEARKFSVASRPASPPSSLPVSPPSASQDSGQSSSSDDFKGFQPNSFDSSAGSPPLSPVMSPARPIVSEWKAHRNAVKLEPVDPGRRDGSVFKRSPPTPTRFPQTHYNLTTSGTYPSSDRLSRRSMDNPNSRPPSVIVTANPLELSRRHSEPVLNWGVISPPHRAESIGARSGAPPSDAAGGSPRMESPKKSGNSPGRNVFSNGVRDLPVAEIAVHCEVRKPSALRDPKSYVARDPHRTKSTGSLRWVRKHTEDEDEDEEDNSKPAEAAPVVPSAVEAIPEVKEDPTSVVIDKVENILNLKSASTNLKAIPAVAPKKPTWSSWTKGKLLGSGSFGTVFEGVGSNGMFFAVKEVPLGDQGKNAKQAIMQLEQEIALLSEIQHPNIVQYLGTETEEDRLYIFLELVSKGSLASVYKEYDLFTDQIRAYTKQILSGLKYLHDRKIIHRDIKCANILVDTSGVVKLADFGMAKEVDKLDMLKSCKGSAYWMAPEVIDPKKTYNWMADIWSVGCTVLEMATGDPPFGDLEWHRALWKVGHGEAPPVPESLEEDLKDFITKCLEVNVAKRPTCDMLLTHPFVTGAPMSGPVKLVGVPELASIAEERSIDLTTNTEGMPTIPCTSPSTPPHKDGSLMEGHSQIIPGPRNPGERGEVSSV